MSLFCSSPLGFACVLQDMAMNMVLAANDNTCPDNSAVERDSGGKVERKN